MKKLLDIILILCDEKKTFWSVFASICLWIVVLAVITICIAMCIGLNAEIPFIIMAWAMIGVLFGFIDL